MPDFVPAKFCPGCGYSIMLMMLNKILNETNAHRRAVLGLDIGCALLALHSLPINTFHTHHGRVVPTMVGFKRARPESLCLGLVGDGGAYAIGLQGLIHAAKRDEPITVLVANNTVYAMTGGQSAPTTLKGQKTDTDPSGCIEEPLLGPELLRDVVKPGALLARSAVNDPKGLKSSLEQAIQAQQAGHFSLVEVLIFCPTNWRTVGQDTLNHLEGLKTVFRPGIISSR